MESSLRQTFDSLISNIQPTTPLLVLGVVECDEDQDDETNSIINKLFSREEETFTVQEPTLEHRQAFFKQILDAITAMPDFTGES